MSIVVVVAWLGALGLMLARAIAAVVGARAAPDQIVGRARVLVWAGVAAVLGAAAVWVWSVSLAARAAAPRAVARVELRAVRVPFDRPIVIGFSPTADVELPPSWTIDELDRGADVLRISPDGDGVAIAAVVDGASRTRVVLREGRDEREALEVAIRAGCDAPTAIAATGARSVAVLLCRGDRAIAALAAHRDGDGALRLTPRVRRGGVLGPHHHDVAAGAAIELGAASGAVPGLPSWELPAPRGHADVLVAPDDPSAGCPAWAEASGAIATAGDRACRLALAGTFDVEIRASVPDVAGLAARTGWAAAFLLGPPLLALLALASARRGSIDRTRVARLATLAWIAVVAAALAAVRLAWAHRIDVLRDLDAAGPRTHLAAALVVATGALLASACVAAVIRGRARLPLAFAALLGWAAVGTLAVVGPVRHGVGLALAVALLAAAGHLPIRARKSRPEVLLTALAVVACVLATIAPQLVAAKLALAWLIPVVAYDALRSGRVAVSLAALITALGALFLLDAGVTIAIAAPGVIAAAVVVTHDLLYHPRDARLLDRWERHQRPLTLGHAAIVGGGAIVIALAVALDLAARGIADAGLPARATTAALHLPALIAIAMIPAAILARRRGVGAGALIPAAIAVLAASVWLGRGALLDRAVESRDASGKRVAAVVAPGYALLRDERSLVAALTAWRETRVDGSSLAGDGYFGAEIDDPGVSVSIENDYLAVLVVREAGVAGTAATTALLLFAIAGAWSLGAASRSPGASGTRRRTAIALTAGAVTVYQPLAALGVLPLTGVSWPGLGLDSPSDVLVHLAVLAWLAAAGRSAADAHELAVRGSPRWRRASRATAAALGLAIAAGTLVVARGAGFAAGRPGAISDGVARAVSYAGTLSCAPPAATTLDALPSTLLGAPTDDDTARYHAELGVRWRRARADVLAAASAFVLGRDCASRGVATAHADGDHCELAVDAGWPTIHVTVDRGPGELRGLRCRVDHDRDALSPLRPAATAADPRIRLVGTATGAAVADRAELVSDHFVLRLRPGTTPDVDLSATDAGLVTASGARLGPDVTIRATAAGARVVAAAGTARLLVAEPRSGRPPRWRRIGATDDVPLDAEITGVAVLVVDTGSHRRAWLVRAAPPGTPLAPLLADDLGSGAGARRHYVYGGALPELGWVDRANPRHSLGLDGWVHAAVAAPSATPLSCGTLDPPTPSSPCAPSAADGVLECRLPIDPLLEIQLRHLTELVALDPAYAPTPATRAGFVLLRGDTGEILATADFVPGRASSAYAPGTPAVARALHRLREEPGESSAEKFELARPIAIGSTLKPFVARAAELTAPALTARATVLLDPSAPRTCLRGRDVHDLLGHCPPRELLDHRHAGWVDFHDYLATSSNAFHALLGLLAPGWPDGRFRAAGVELPAASVLDYAPTGWSEPLVVEYADQTVIGARSVRIDPLRTTPFWRQLEDVLGRPMCALGSAAACSAAADRRDLCAARALPITSPTADLRHLVALGPATFDMYSAGADPTGAVPVGEYFQLLRGSGVHPIGSLAQLTDAFNRLVFDGADPPYHLAASWFPAPAVGRIPSSACTPGGRHAERVLGDDGGLCGVLRPGGTAARAFADLLDDPRVILYAAKTGTIDTLADVGEHAAACAAWNRAHTLADRPARAASQPYWLTCGTAAPDDSLFVISVGIRVGTAIVPLTLGVSLERTGKGAAAHAARAYLDAVIAHLTSSP